MSRIGIPKIATTALMVIDVQERLMPVIHGKEDIFVSVNKLIAGAEILGLQTIVTEQYPKGLGPTCAEIALPAGQTLFQKMTFSCMQSAEILDQLKQNEISDLIICGVEAHICVLKTALEALEQGFTVNVVADAVSSRTPENKQLSLDRMRHSGAFIVSVEMILFMLLNEAGTDAFKAISKLIK